MARFVVPSGLAGLAAAKAVNDYSFVAITCTAFAAGVVGHTFTPLLGDRVWLDHVWIWGHPRNVADYYEQVYFEIYKVTKQPGSDVEIMQGENVLPIYFQHVHTRWGLGYGVWQMDFSIGRWFEGPSLRFAMYGVGIFTANVNLQAAFRYRK